MAKLKYWSSFICTNDRVKNFKIGNVKQTVQKLFLTNSICILIPHSTMYISALPLGAWKLPGLWKEESLLRESRKCIKLKWQYFRLDFQMGK